MEENVLTLTNTRTHAQESFQIEDELGRGGSRTAFRAKRRGKQDEPALLVTLKRLDGDGALSESQYERFRHCCKTHVELTNNGLANFIPAIMDDYESQEGVRYAVTALVDGQTMDKKQFETLHEYLKVLCDLADVVAAFHKKGWLLLDIKTANILVKDEDRGVTLIDLDSLLHEDELGHGKPVLVGTSAGSGDPYLPDNVSTAADVYSLGAMLFQKILGRWPASLDRWPTARYDFEKAWGSGELTNQLCRCLTKLFRKTLTPPAMRWSMEKLEAALRQLAALTDPARLRLRVEKRSVQGLLGREDEYKALLEMLHKPEKKPVFIWGKPGMGKSSLASEFAARYKNEFDFQIVPFAGTLRQTILNIATNDAATLQLQLDERYREIIKCLSDCDEKTVLIIDGFDAEDGADTGALRRCEEFYELLRLPVRLVFTTKFHFPRENEYDSLPISPLKEKDLLWLMRDDDREIRDRASLRKIMTLIEQNTLVANIAGCTIRYSYGRITAAGLLDRLRAGSCDDENEVESWHNNVLQYGNMLYHLRTLFRLANMNEAAKHVLSCMCLTGHSGISADLLRKNISKEWWNAAQYLSKSGWLQCDGESTFTMHDLPRMVCMNDETVKPTWDGVEGFVSKWYEVERSPEVLHFLRLTQKEEFIQNTLKLALPLEWEFYMLREELYIANDPAETAHQIVHLLEENSELTDLLTPETLFWIYHELADELSYTDIDTARRCLMKARSVLDDMKACGVSADDTYLPEACLKISEAVGRTIIKGKGNYNKRTPDMRREVYKEFEYLLIEGDIFTEYVIETERSFCTHMDVVLKKENEERLGFDFSCNGENMAEIIRKISCALGKALYRMGDFVRAAKVLEAAVRQLNDMLPESRFYAAEVSLLLETVYFEMGRVQEARELFYHIREVYMDLAPIKDSIYDDIKLSMYCCAVVYAYVSGNMQAVAEAETGLEAQKSLLGCTAYIGVPYIRTLDKIYGWLSKLGIESAAEYYHKKLEIYFGRGSHPIYYDDKFCFAKLTVKLPIP